MKTMSTIAAVLLLTVMAAGAAAKTADEYIEEAQALVKAGQNAEALALMEEAAAEYPEDSDVMAYYGMYTGMGAGNTSDFMEAGRLMTLSFQRLDRAVELGPGNPTAYLLRGIMGIKVPDFLGRLPAGIKDLEKAEELYSKAEGEEAAEGRVTALTMLAEGYGKAGDIAGQRKALEALIEAAPETDAAKAAAEKLASLPEAPEGEEAPSVFDLIEGDSEKVAGIKKSLKESPENASLVLALGKAYYDEGSYARARDVLKRYTEISEDDVEGWMLLAMSYGRIAETGYDEHIYDDTNYMSNLAFEATAAIEKAAELDPDDYEIRLAKGIWGIQMPFFLGKHEEAAKDLEALLKTDAPDSIKAEAMYHLGVARQREGMRYWIDIAKKFPDSEAAKMAYEGMRPHIERIDPADYEKPFVEIDFVLGFEDELAPQIAVWIEDDEENYVRTIYVSGFAGYVKEKQVTLPVWSAMSEYRMDTDAVTSASINVGHHVYTWDLTDYEGNRVKKGDYKVRVEGSWWPSMKYQNVEAMVTAGGKQNEAVVEEGVYIPFLKVIYHR